MSNARQEQVGRIADLVEETGRAGREKGWHSPERKRAAACLFAAEENASPEEIAAAREEVLDRRYRQS